MINGKEEKISKYGWVAIIGVGIALITDGMDFMSLALCIPQIMKEFGVSHTAAGALATFTLFGIAGGAVLSGWTADRFGRVRTLMYCIAIFTVFTTMVGFITTYWQMAVLRFLSGAGIGAAYAVGTMVVGEFVPTRVVATANSTIVAGYSAGFAVAAMMGSFIMPTWGWRPMFYMALIPGVLAIAICSRLHEPPGWKVSKELMAAKKIKQSNEFAILWHDKALRKTTIIWALTAACASSAYYGANIWLPTYVTKELGVNLRHMAWFMAGSYGCTVVGKIIAGKMADKYGRKIIWVLSGIVTAMFMPFLVYFATQQSIQYLLLAFGLLYGAQFGIVGTYILECYPIQVRGTGLGVSYNCGRLIATLAPLAMGYIGGKYSIGLGLAFLGILFLLDTLLPAIFIKDHMYELAAIPTAAAEGSASGDK